VVVLHDVHGFSMDEIATLTHTTRGEAQTRLHRARVFLRARLAALMAIDVSS
jgi:DNA-directed RNA polymerase specialized sigma24 family protein